MQEQGSRSSIRLIHPPASARALARDAVALFRAKRQDRLQIARDQVAVIAETQRHVLGPWRPDGATGELTQCGACGEGARLDVVSATVRLTEGLDAPCAGGSDLACHATIYQHTAVSL